jgi:hypothetical protein
MILSSFNCYNNTGWSVLNTLFGQAPQQVQNLITTDTGAIYNAVDASSPYFYSFTPNIINPGLQVPVFRNVKPNTIAQIKTIYLRGGAGCGYNWATDMYFIYGTAGNASPIRSVPLAGPYVAGYGSTRNATPIINDNPGVPNAYTALAPVQIDFPYPVEVSVGNGVMLFLQDIPNAGQGVQIAGSLIGRYVNV